MHIDFKVVVWKRLHIPEGHKEDVLQKIKDKEIYNSYDLINLFPTISFTQEEIDSTEESLSIVENGYQPTMEVFVDGEDDAVWNNLNGINKAEIDDINFPDYFKNADRASEMKGDK